MDDLISRQAAIDAIEHRLAEPAYQHRGEDWYVGMSCAESELYELPSAQPTLYGYDIDKLKVVADALTAKGLTPEAYVDLITDTGRVVQMVLEEQRELRKALEAYDYNDVCIGDCENCPNGAPDGEGGYECEM